MSQLGSVLGGAAAKAVGSTAGLAGLASVLKGLPDLSGLKGLSLGPGVGYGTYGTGLNSAQQLAVDNPGEYKYVNGPIPGMESSRNGVVYDANGQPSSTSVLATLAAGVQPPSSASGSSSTGPSLGDVLSALLGPAPTASDYFDPSTYQSALANLQSGQKSATGTINSAYDQAVNSQQGIDKIAAQNTANEQALLNTDIGRGANAVNGFVQNAQSLGGAGGQLGARLDALQALQAEQTAQEKMMNDQLGAVGQYNTTQGESALTDARANALAALASSVQGATNKITAQEASDQAKGDNAYQKALAAYQQKANTYEAQASKGAQASGALGGKDWGHQQIATWAQAGANGDKNALALSNAAQNLIAPAQGSKTAPTYAEALQKLNAGAASVGGPNSIMYGILNNWLQNYYGYSNQNLSSAADRQNAMANYLMNTYGIGQ